MKLNVLLKVYSLCKLNIKYSSVMLHWILQVANHLTISLINFWVLSHFHNRWIIVSLFDWQKVHNESHLIQQFICYKYVMGYVYLKPLGNIYIFYNRYFVILYSLFQVICPVRISFIFVTHHAKRDLLGNYVIQRKWRLEIMFTLTSFADNWITLCLNWFRCLHI